MPTPVVVALWMLVSAIGFAAVLVVVRELSESLHVFALNFWRNVFAAAIILPWLFRVGLGALKTARLPLFALRSLVMVTSSIMLFYSAVLMPIGEATAITFTAPLFTTLLAAVMLKETVGWRRAAALGIGFCGVLIMLRPGVESVGLGAAMAIGASLFFAFVVIMGKQLSASESPVLVVLMLGIWNIPVSAVPAAFVWDMPEGREWLLLVGLGIAANMNMYGIQRAISAGDASLSQVFDFMRLPLAAFAAWLAFSEVPDPFMWVGAAVIFAATLYTTQRESRLARRKA